MLFLNFASHIEIALPLVELPLFISSMRNKAMQEGYEDYVLPRGLALSILKPKTNETQCHSLHVLPLIKIRLKPKYFSTFNQF